MKTYIFECTNQDKDKINEMLTQGGFIEQAVFLEEKLNSENAGHFSDAESVSVFVNSQVNESVINSLPKLKYISTRSTGFDHIDLKVAREKNISVSNVPAYGSRTVAEFAFALILGLSRKTFFAYSQVKQEHSYNIANFEGFNLEGKTIGIVGTGRIGQNAAQIAKGFNMQILAFDAFPKTELEASLGLKYVELKELLSKSDVITLHVPYNKDTHHLINLENIKQIKPGAILVNTARGEVAQTEALLYALENKILSGLGIDVIEQEKLLLDESKALKNANPEQVKILEQNHALINNPKVVFTPHIAFFSTEAKQEILNTSVQNILAQNSGSPVNLVK
jgi:D-lactate dehydrogenase